MTKSVTLSVSYGPNGQKNHIKQHNNHQYYDQKVISYLINNKNIYQIPE